MSIPPAAIETMQEPKKPLTCSYHHFISPSYPSITWLLLSGLEARKFLGLFTGIMQRIWAEICTSSSYERKLYRANSTELS